MLAAWALVFPAGVSASQPALETGMHQIAVDLATSLRGQSVRKLAVVDFAEVRGYPSALDHFISEELVTQLLQLAPGEFDIVERRQLARVLEEQKLSSSALFDQAAIANVGKILGLDAIITGSITDLGEEVKVNARAISVETAQIFAAASARLAKAGEVEYLLAQTAGPNGSPSDSRASTGRVDRQVQAPDVFFQNDFLRVTVTSLTLDSTGRSANLVLMLENLGRQDLLLGLETPAYGAECAAALADPTGTVLYPRNSSSAVSGLPCLYPADQDEAEEYAVLSPRTRATAVLEMAGDRRKGPARPGLFSLGMTLMRLDRGHPRKFTVGISNIVGTQAPASSG